MVRQVLGTIFLIVSISNGHTEVVRHAQVQERYTFGISLLELALSKVGDFKVVGPRNQYVNEARLDAEVIKGNIDIQFISTTVEREMNMIPIRIPIYRGLLGLRLLLQKKDSKIKINGIEDLRKLKAAHGQHWKDIGIYDSNELPVKPEVKYEQMFTLLKKDRVDYFHRGVSEIWEEYKHHSNELEINKDVMLFYKHPVYFFVSPKRVKLAKKIQKGLEISLKDGSFKKLFEQEFKTILKKSNLNSRKMIHLKNPSLPKSAQKLDTSWWSKKAFK